MKYKLLKPLPNIPAGYIYDDSLVTNTVTGASNGYRIKKFIDTFGTDNEFIKTIKEPKYCDPKEGEEYYLISDIGNIYSRKYFQDVVYDCASSMGNVYETLGDAMKERNKRQAITRCKRYLVENDMLLTSEEALSDDGSQYKYVQYMYGDHIETTGVENCLYYSPYGYINSRTNADKFINDCEEDLKTIHSPI